VMRKQNQFFELLVQITDNLLVAGKEFEAHLTNFTTASQFATSLKELEDVGDEYTHNIIRLLNATYITPIEREDILGLASTLDDILDGMEACAARFDLYDINETNPIMIAFASNINGCIRELSEAMEALRAKRLMTIRNNTKRINELENEGDKLLRGAIKSLLAQTNDALTVMKYKEIYELMESISDACEDVADLLESVVMTNA